MAKRIEELIRSKREKLEELRSLGVDPYPQTANRKHTTLQAKMKMNKNVSVAGRIRGLRGHGAIAFTDLEDESGRIQLFFNKKDLKRKQVKILENVDIGDFVQASGRIFKTEAGEVTVRVKTFRLLSKSVRPLPSTWYGFKDVEERYRKRYVDFIMNPDSKKVIELRSKIVSEVRNILEKRGFIEIETPTLQPVYGGANARPFTTYYNALKQDFYLKISDELYLKRLIIGGFEKVFEIDHDFRNEGIDATHNPEFTMMECYWAYADYNDMMKLTEEIYSKVAKKVLGTTKVEYNGHKIDLKAPWKRITMKDSIRKYLKVDVDKLNDKQLKKELKGRKLKIGKRGNRYNRGLSIASLFEAVEEHLIQPTFVIDFPKETTSLCKLHRVDSSLIERFEPYIAGSEVGNAYTELNDPDLQRHFFEEEAKAKEGGDEETHPSDEDFLLAMEYGMPPTGGLGLGIDRMAMIITGTTSIRDIIAFPTLKKRGTKVKDLG